MYILLISLLIVACVNAQASKFKCSVTGETASGPLCCSNHCSPEQCGAPYTGESKDDDKSSCGVQGEGCCTFEAMEDKAGVRECLDTLAPPCVLPAGDKTPIVKCESKIDLIFAIDVSGSVDFKDYEYMRNWIERIGLNIGVGASDSRVGIIKFAKKAEVVTEGGLEHRVTNLRNTIKDLPTRESEYKTWQNSVDRSSTHFDPMLVLAAQTFTEKKPQRQTPRRALVVLSDGKPSDSPDRSFRFLRMTEAQRQRDPDSGRSTIASLGVEVFTVTVGSSKSSNMAKWASPHAETHALHAKDYDKLEQTSGSLTEYACPPVLPLPCEKPVDMVFVLDSSGSVGSGNWNIMKQFIADVISRGGVRVDGTQSQIGIVSFGTKATIHSQLEQDPQKLNVLLGSDGMKYQGGQTHTAYGLQLANEVLSKGANALARRVVVLISDGSPTCESGKGDTCKTKCKSSNCGVKAEADKLKNSLGATLVTIGVGKADVGALKKLASEPKFYLKTPNFESLTQQIDAIGNVGCSKDKCPGGGAYVDNDASTSDDQGQCTASKPCKTLARALEVVGNTGCPIHLFAGVYRGAENFPHFTNGADIDIRCMGHAYEACTFDAGDQPYRWLVDQGSFVRISGIDLVGSSFETGVLHIQEASVELRGARLYTASKQTNTLMTVNGGSLRAIQSVFESTVTGDDWTIGIRVMQTKDSIVHFHACKIAGFTFGIASDGQPEPFETRYAQIWADPQSEPKISKVTTSISLRDSQLINCDHGIHLFGNSGSLELYNVRFVAESGKVTSTTALRGDFPINLAAVYVNVASDFTIRGSVIEVSFPGTVFTPKGKPTLENGKIVHGVVDLFGEPAAFSIQYRGSTKAKAGTFELSRAKIYCNGWGRGFALGGRGVFHIADSFVERGRLYHSKTVFATGIGTAVYIRPAAGARASDMDVTMRGLAFDLCEYTAVHAAGRGAYKLRRSFLDNNGDGKNAWISCPKESDDVLFDMDQRTYDKFTTHQFAEAKDSVTNAMYTNWDYKPDDPCVSEDIIKDDGLRIDGDDASIARISIATLSVVIAVALF